MFSNVHHVAIIGTNYRKAKEFYVDKLGFKVLSEHIRIEKNDIILNVQQGNLVLEIKMHRLDRRCQIQNIQG